MEPIYATYDTFLLKADQGIEMNLEIRRGYFYMPDR
jgi:hypothetical protein